MTIASLGGCGVYVARTHGLSRSDDTPFLKLGQGLVNLTVSFQFLRALMNSNFGNEFPPVAIRPAPFLSPMACGVVILSSLKSNFKYYASRGSNLVLTKAERRWRSY